jgi:hypothetical protein
MKPLLFCTVPKLVTSYLDGTIALSSDSSVELPSRFRVTG